MNLLRFNGPHSLRCIMSAARSRARTTTAEPPNERMQLTELWVVTGWPALPVAARAVVIHSRSAADPRRYPDEWSRRRLETFSKPRELVDYGRFSEDREDALQALDLRNVDEPIREIVGGFGVLSHCFTLQSCHGHFLYAPDQDPHSLARLPNREGGRVRYRIAYMAFCLENSPRGHAMRVALAQIPAIDMDYVQFGSADWFWQRHPNSYALQVEPARHMNKDEAVLTHAEALHTQRIRDLFFVELERFLREQLREPGAG